MSTKENSGSNSSDVSRRSLFQIIGSVPALAAVTAGAGAAQEHNHDHAPSPSAEKGPYKRQTFDDGQWRTVCVLCDLIIPADERSGSATQAGVPEFLDDWIAFRTVEDGNEDLKAQIFGGLMWLDREALRLSQKNFADAGEATQKQILDRVAFGWGDPERRAPLSIQAKEYSKKAAKIAKEDGPWVLFFNEFRSLTVGGFFSSKMGVGDLPYLGNQAVAHWDGCDPKVWAVIEDRMKNGYKGILESKPWNNMA